MTYAAEVIVDVPTMQTDQPLHMKYLNICAL